MKKDSTTSILDQLSRSSNKINDKKVSLDSEPQLVNCENPQLGLSMEELLQLCLSKKNDLDSKPS